MTTIKALWTAWAPEWRKRELQVDSVLLFASVSLLIIGYVMVTSASLHLGHVEKGNSLHYPIRQLAHIVLGVGAGFMVALVPTEFWERRGQSLFLAGLGLLVVVLLVGEKINGSTRWLSVFGVAVQVSELVKLISVIYLAGYIARHVASLRESWHGMLRPLLLFAVASALLLKQPDFGSSAVIVATAFALLFMGGARLGQFLALLSGVVLTAGLLLVYFIPYGLPRLIAFLNPWEHPLGKGFQLVQALIAFGRGEWFGVGLGGSVQKLSYLPEAHTDFVFSVLAEELGLFGVTAVVLLFAAIVWRAFVIGYRAEVGGRMFAAFLAYGLGIWFGFQAFINMGVNMAMLPTKGLTLPLMSYGGSSMVVMCVSLALLFRVDSELADPRRRDGGKWRWLGV